jgi:hypothetical protein
VEKEALSAHQDPFALNPQSCHQRDVMVGGDFGVALELLRFGIVKKRRAVAQIPLKEGGRRSKRKYRQEVEKEALSAN